MVDVKNLININERKGLPRTYRFRQFLRWFTLFWGVAAIVYAVYLVINRIDADTSKYYKIIPFIILFLAATSIMRNIFSLNTVVFTIEGVKFKFLAKKSTFIPAGNLKKMELDDGKHKQIKLKYISAKKEETFMMPISFPGMLEIVNSIAELNPTVELDEFMTNVIVSEKEKAKNAGK
jgi:hypothetical protein